jgi:hypothetical protein
MKIAMLDSNDIVLAINEHQYLFPDVSFPESGPTTDWMAANNVVPAVTSQTYDPLTQKSVSVIPYVSAGVAYTTKIESLTESQKTVIKTDSNGAVAAANRAQRDTLLAETDWMVLKATETGATLADDWKTYRQALRDLPQHANWPHLKTPEVYGSGNNDWPVKPT